MNAWRMKGNTVQQTRKLGNLEVSAIGLGCMSMTAIYSTPDEAEAIATIRCAVDLDVTLIDTSDAYGQNGSNEELVGRALKGLRDKVVLSTKFGNIRLPDGTPGANGNPDYARKAFEASLRRLDTDYIDLYFVHRVDPTVPIEDTVGALSRLVEQGKIRHIGLSEAGMDTLRRAHAVHPIAALQTEYSLWSREVEAETLKVCEELGVGFLAYAPLGRGFLTGTIESGKLEANDRRRAMPRFQEGNVEHNARKVEVLRKLAVRQGCTPAQLALAWLLSRTPPVVPLVGTKQRKWLEENLSALRIVPSADTLSELDRTFSPEDTAGMRYPEAMMKRLGL